MVKFMQRPAQIILCFFVDCVCFELGEQIPSEHSVLLSDGDFLLNIKGSKPTSRELANDAITLF